MRKAGRRGFLNSTQVCAIARAHGFAMKERTLRVAAASGRVPFAGKHGGREWLFPERKIIPILASAPKSAIIPREYLTRHALMRRAKKMGLTIHQQVIDQELEKMWSGKEPAPAGIARSLWGHGRPFLLPEKFANQMIREAVLRKRLPELLASGGLVPLLSIGRGLGLSGVALNARRDIEKIRIGGAIYVTGSEAESFKQYYRAEKARGARYVRARNIERELPEARNRRAAAEWLAEKSTGLKPDQRRLAQSMIKQYLPLPPHEFRFVALHNIERALKIPAEPKA